MYVTDYTTHVYCVIVHYVCDLLIPVVCMAFIFVDATIILDSAVMHL